MAKCAHKSSRYKVSCEDDLITVYPKEKQDKLGLHFEGRLKTEENGSSFVGKLKYDKVSYLLLLVVSLVCLALMIYMIVVKNASLAFVYLAFVLILGGVAVRIRQLTSVKINALKNFLKSV